jgi:hypothetical protein
MEERKGVGGGGACGEVLSWGIVLTLQPIPPFPLGCAAAQYPEPFYHNNLTVKDFSKDEPPSNIPMHPPTEPPAHTHLQVAVRHLAVAVHRPRPHPPRQLRQHLLRPPDAHDEVAAAALQPLPQISHRLYEEPRAVGACRVAYFVYSWRDRYSAWESGMGHAWGAITHVHAPPHRGLDCPTQPSPLILRACDVVALGAPPVVPRVKAVHR